MTEQNDLFENRKELEIGIRDDLISIKNRIDNAIADGLYPDGLTVNVNQALTATYLINLLKKSEAIDIEPEEDDPQPDPEGGNEGEGEA